MTVLMEFSAHPLEMYTNLGLLLKADLFSNKKIRLKGSIRNIEIIFLDIVLVDARIII